MRTAYIVCGPTSVLLKDGGVFSAWEGVRSDDRVWATTSLVKARRLAASWRREDVAVCVGWFVRADELEAPDVVQLEQPSLFERAS